MGFPAESISGMYRNNLKDVQRFFTKRHPGKQKLYNLCSERSYDPAKFDNRVLRVPFDDHNPCPIDMIEPFCKDASDWLSASPGNVVAIHCKAGKGRTGFLISCYLLYSGMFTDANHALRFYAMKRTKNAKGVTIPSQIR